MKSLKSISMLFLTLTLPFVVSANSLPSTEKIVADAFEKLGHITKSFLDLEKEPHLVLQSQIKGVKNTAVFFDDCNYKNQCEDITFYSHFKKGIVSDERINAWNHIGSKTRSKAFKNNDGSAGISMTVSFINHEDTDGIDMLTGLFILESELIALPAN